MDEKDNTLTDTDTAESVAENTEPAEKASVIESPPEAPQNQPRYDSFMYEPIGFQQNARINPEEMRAIEEVRMKKQHIRHERTMIVLFFILILITLILGIFGIIYDIAHSKSSLAGLNVGQNVIIYQNSKPDGANDLGNFVDENGRYTTEGAAASVRNSIVEIYTYSDTFHKNLLGTGSGVILTSDGYIVTNAHVLSATGYHDVHTADEKIYSAKVIGRDSKTDIAVLKVNSDDLSPAILGDSDEVMVGEQVIAVGNPAGLSNTVTDGIVSAVNRKVRSDSTGFEMDCIQTNADISPGNSGGALVNMYGQVIGITSSKYANTLYEGLGFAITINEAKPIIEELINNGFVGGRFRIGITLIGMNEPSSIYAIESELGFELPEDFSGVYINDISEDCDIANTALQKGDFIIEINGIPISSYDDLYNAISASFGAGDKVPAKCAHVSEDGTVTTYDIEFMLMEDTSGDY
ncbi:MAG: trypsin-like peptidase domain-containing protein [Ruminococcus flavefaciens]|nr:trypsin-like peptidase domain-containing protein [Ruminococcus flavefaciens]MCM1228816.1 trypsin-like peptidase domain-containing protein [Ruminococcus flavefaciens]